MSLMKINDEEIIIGKIGFKKKCPTCSFFEKKNGLTSCKLAFGSDPNSEALNYVELNWKNKGHGVWEFNLEAIKPNCKCYLIDKGFIELVSLEMVGKANGNIYR